jgi:hypothetical protein
MNTQRRTMHRSILIFLALLIGGCINISAQLQPINESVKADKTSSDCAGINFGFGFGSLTVERAMMNMMKVKRIYDPLNLGPSGTSEPSTEEKVPYITKIRSIALHDTTFLFFGERCIEVTGE